MSVAPEELDRREWPRQYMQRRPLVALCSVSHISRARLMCMEDVPQKVANHKPGWSMTCLFRRARPGTWSYGLAGTWRSLIPVHLDRNNSSATSAGLVSLSKANIMHHQVLDVPRVSLRRNVQALVMSLVSDRLKLVKVQQ